jgi:hypothetical protein
MMRRGMHKEDEKDQFELLEMKVDSLIRFAGSLKKERESLLEKLRSRKRR